MALGLRLALCGRRGRRHNAMLVDVGAPRRGRGVDLFAGSAGAGSKCPGLAGRLGLLNRLHRLVHWRAGALLRGGGGGRLQRHLLSCGRLGAISGTLAHPLAVVILKNLLGVDVSPSSRAKRLPAGLR